MQSKETKSYQVPEVVRRSNFFTVEVISKRELTYKTFEMKVRLIEPEEANFKAGHFMVFIVGPKDKRIYSIASSPHNKKELTFIIDISPMGLGSKLVIALQPGDIFDMQGPLGVFMVKDKIRDALFVATGAGVAPFVSMIPDMLEEQKKQNALPARVTLLLGVHNEKSILYFDFFERLAKEYPNFSFLPALSKPEGDWGGIKGRVTKFLEKNGEFYAGADVYVCGGTEMIKDVRALLLLKGFPMDKIKFENYG